MSGSSSGDPNSAQATPVAVVDQRRVRDPLGHQTLLERPVPLAALALLRTVGVELRAPAAGEHAPVPLDESGEVVEGLRCERLDREIGHAGKLNRLRTFVVRQLMRCHGAPYAPSRAKGAARRLLADARSSADPCTPRARLPSVLP